MSPKGEIYGGAISRESSIIMTSVRLQEKGRQILLKEVDQAEEGGAVPFDYENNMQVRIMSDFPNHRGIVQCTSSVWLNR